MPDEPRIYEFWIGFFVSIGAFISTLEWLANRTQLQDNGLFSWPVFQTRGIAIRPEWLERTLSWMVSSHRFLWVLTFRLAALLGVPVALWYGHGSALFLAVALVSSLAMHFRCPFGMDGSDQMATQVFGALLLGQLSGSLLGHKCALWYICAQACLSYFTSGMAKAISPHWRDGKVVFGIFNTRTYGYEPAARLLLNRPALTRVLGMGAVFMECAFPFCLLMGFPECLMFIAWGVAFHTMNAVIMGLNSFFWSFVATYPAVIYSAIAISATLRR